VLGFFLDGEEAQLPCVLGAFRGFQQLESDGATTIADAGPANELKTDTPQQTDLTNVNARSGSPFPKNENTPASPTGDVEEARGGGINMAEAVVPGNAVTNPAKPPVNAVGIADGVAGPAGKGFEKDMSRMLTELGEMAAGPATPSAIPTALTGGLAGLVTALPGTTASAILIPPPLASSTSPVGEAGVFSFLGNGDPDLALTLVRSVCCGVSVFNSFAGPASAIVVAPSDSNC
jgi:hypothetical protein